MSLSIDLIKTPYEVSFTGNPIPFMFACSPWGSVERNQDIRLSIRVEVEEQFGTNVFAEKKNMVYTPDNDGEVYVDISSILDAYVEFYTPRLSNTNPVQAIQQRKRFRLLYLLQQNNIPVGTTVTSDVFFAIKGGMSKEQFEPVKFFAQRIAQYRQPLNYYSNKEKVAPYEKRFLWWLYTEATPANMVIEYKVFLNDDTEAVLNLDPNFLAGKWGVCCIAAGFEQAGLQAVVPNGKYAVKYTITIQANNINIVDGVVFYLDYKKTYNDYQLLYRTSTGALETLRLTGQTDTEAEYDRQLATRTNAPNWYQSLILQPESITTYTEETLKIKGDTGFKSKEKIDLLRDLFLSKNVYELKDGKIVPVVIAGKSAKFFSNKDSLFSMQIEWQNAFASNYYTPTNLFNAAACPAMDKLVVKQKNKTLLQIMYSIPMPYDRVEITIDNGSTQQVFMVTGNTKSFTTSFINPATTTPVNITIKGRVVCDEDATPIDAGAFTTVVLSVTGDSLPIANNDTYNIAAGGTAVILAGSVLANDYDPDGDAIAVVVASGATAQGGTYSIDAAGNITYTAPSSSFNGVDSFDYELEQASTATGVTATVTINVGATPTGVFAKLAYRNVVTQGGSQSGYQTGEVWIDFFGDPAGTIPLDITNNGLTINYQSTESYLDSSGSGTSTNNASIAGTSNKVKIFEGELSSFTPGPNQGDPDYYHNISFIVTAGTGYSPI